MNLVLIVFLVFAMITVIVNIQLLGNLLNRNHLPDYILYTLLIK